MVNEDRSFKADVLCQDGKIIQVSDNIPVTDDVRVVDATDKLVMPGGIDTHTHMQLPFMGTVAADDFYQGKFTWVIIMFTVMVIIVLLSDLILTFAERINSMYELLILYCYGKSCCYGHADSYYSYR